MIIDLIVLWFLGAFATFAWFVKDVLSENKRAL